MNAKKIAQKSNNKMYSNNNRLTDWQLQVKLVFQMIDKENRIPQLYCMRKECLEEGRPHIAAYIDNRIGKIQEGIA